jgi:hypothetical protein
MAGVRIEGNTSGNLAEVSAANQLITTSETDVFANPNNVGAQFSYVENDAGAVTGVKVIRPQEIDLDYRTRVSTDLVLDEEVFNYTGQNSGKHSYINTTMTNTWTAGQITTNATSITTLNTGTQITSYAHFPMLGTNTTSIDVECAFSAQPVTNTIIEFGIGLTSGIGQITAPTEGIFLRLNSAGLQGIASFNGTEVSTGVFPLADGTGTWVYSNNKRHQFIIYAGGVQAEFWVNDGTGAVLLGAIPLPSGQSRMTMANAGQFFYKHRIVGGAAGGVMQSYLGAYCVRLGGSIFSNVPSTSGNRLYGAYQGLSGGTMGSLANYANSANPTAAVPTNTTAALGTGLGGQFWETDTLAVTTDGIICSYQLPASSVNYSGRRLVVRGVRVQSYVQTALTGGGYVAQWSLAFGHTAVSLATAEAAATKAPRRIPLGIQTVASAAAALTVLQEVEMDLGDAPVFVNPSEFIAVVKKKVGAAPSAGVIGHVIKFVYGWE